MYLPYVYHFFHFHLSSFINPQACTEMIMPMCSNGDDDDAFPKQLVRGRVSELICNYCKCIYCVLVMRNNFWLLSVKHRKLVLS